MQTCEQENISSRKRSYRQVKDSQRVELIKLLTGDNISIREASEQVGINYENAKAIYRIYRLDKRVCKQKKQVTCSQTSRQLRDFKQLTRSWIAFMRAPNASQIALNSLANEKTCKESSYAPILQSFDQNCKLQQQLHELTIQLQKQTSLPPSISKLAPLMPVTSHYELHGDPHCNSWPLLEQPSEGDADSEKEIRKFLFQSESNSEEIMQPQEDQQLFEELSIELGRSLPFKRRLCTRQDRDLLNPFESNQKLFQRVNQIIDQDQNFGLQTDSLGRISSFQKQTCQADEVQAEMSHQIHNQESTTTQGPFSGL